MDINRVCIRIDKNKKLIFSYNVNGKIIKEKRILERIKKLRIPPNWENVKISNSELSHLQAIGCDSKKTQYIYHPMWVLLTSAEKYNRMGEFSKKIGLLESKIRQDLNY